MFEAAERGDGRVDDLARVLSELEGLARHVASTAAATTARTSPGRLDAIGRLDRVVGLLTTAKAHLLVAERDAGTSHRSGDRSFAGTRARQTGAGYGAAVRELRRAEALTAMPAVAAAVADGRVGLEHVDAIARATASASPSATRALTSSDGQLALVGLAATSDAPTLARRAAELVAAADPAAFEAAHAAQRRARFLTVRDEADGTHVRGLLDHRSGAALRRALAATGVRPHAGRTSAQADADALVALAARGAHPDAGVALTATPEALATPSSTSSPVLGAADHGAVGTTSPIASRTGAPTGGARPHVSLVVPIEALAALRAGRTDEPGAVTTTEDGTPVPFSELARVLCDCEVTRIAVDAAGEPVDLGRTRRTYSGVQRRAVVARDRGCAWNGCPATADECDVHHVRWWRRDHGSTSVRNGVLLCEAHHREVHRRDLSIRRLGPRDGAPPGPARYRFRDTRYGLVNAPPGFLDDTDRFAGAPRSRPRPPRVPPLPADPA